jgi:hypothetical protein
MKRLLFACALALPLLSLATPALADVKTREKNQVKFEGMLGRMFNLFGGKGAREGTITTEAVKGDRKATLGDNSGRIVDLNEEKEYEIDFKKKTYKVTTFEEIRRRMREAQERAEKEAREAEKEEKAEKRDPGKEMEVDFDVKETGQHKQIAGYDTREVVMTITVREKGKTLDESGGIVMTTNSWHGPDIPHMKESLDFEMRYWQKLQAGETAAISAEQMATIMALYPMFKPAMERMKKEEHKLKGTVLATTMVVEAVKSKAAMTEQQSESGGGGGLGGMLARRIAKREPPKQRATFMTLNREVLEVGTSVAPTDLAIPPDFKEKK